jgi:hypothetical protein
MIVIMMSVIMMSVIMMSVIMMSVIMMRIVILNVFMLSVIVLSVVAPPRWSTTHSKSVTPALLANIRLRLKYLLYQNALAYSTI